MIGAVLACVSGIAAAEVAVNADVGVTSNYVWRGTTQTNDGAAIQGGVNASGDNGLYGSVWASNIETFYGDTGSEVDLTVGFANDIGDSRFGYDVGYTYYAYPQSDNADFGEVFGRVNFGATETVMVSAGAAYTTNVEAGNTGDIYYDARAEIALPREFTLGATVGHYDFEDGSDWDYTHYGVDVTKHAGNYGDVRLSVSKADKEANFNFFDGYDDAAKVYVGWTKRF